MRNPFRIPAYLPLKPETKKPVRNIRHGLFSLAYKDSNLDRQNQNLMCYRYTIGQTLVSFFKSVAKV